MSREINSASAEQDHHATSGVVDKEVQKAIDIQIELAKQVCGLSLDVFLRCLHINIASEAHKTAVGNKRL